jgi:hypothetical protein
MKIPWRLKKMNELETAGNENQLETWETRSQRPTVRTTKSTA